MSYKREKPVIGSRLYTEITTDDTARRLLDEEVELNNTNNRNAIDTSDSLRNILYVDGLFILL